MFASCIPRRSYTVHSKHWRVAQSSHASTDSSLSRFATVRKTGWLRRLLGHPAALSTSSLLSTTFSSWRRRVVWARAYLMCRTASPSVARVGRCRTHVSDSFRLNCSSKCGWRPPMPFVGICVPLFLLRPLFLWPPDWRITGSLLKPGCMTSALNSLRHFLVAPFLVRAFHAQLTHQLVPHDVVAPSVTFMLTIVLFRAVVLLI